MSKVYVPGGSQTDFSRNWAREGLEIYDMFAEVLRDGLNAAAVEPGQIQVGHVGNFVGDLFTGQGLLGGFFGQVFPEMGSIPPSRHEAACASGSIAILSAMRDIEAGHYDMACVLGLELMRNVDGKTGAEHLGAARWMGHEANSADFPWPHMFDRITREYDQRYGIDSEGDTEFVRTARVDDAIRSSLTLEVTISAPRLPRRRAATGYSRWRRSSGPRRRSRAGGSHHRRRPTGP